MIAGHRVVTYGLDEPNAINDAAPCAFALDDFGPLFWSIVEGSKMRREESTLGYEPNVFVNEFHPRYSFRIPAKVGQGEQCLGLVTHDTPKVAKARRHQEGVNDVCTELGTDF